MITINNLSKYFNRHKKNELHVINNTSLSFGDNGLVAILGPSGSGKTTLLNCIGGLDVADSGSININGIKIDKNNYYKMDKIRNLNIGYIFQDYKLIDDLSVFDNVALSLKMCGLKDKKEIKRRVDYVLKTIELDRYSKRKAGMLSGGERQRVGIARALVKNPSIIICDEPTGNLDSRNSIEIMNIIKAISRSKLVILVTHEIDLAKLYADRIISIEDGTIKSDIKNDETHEIDYGNERKIFLKDLDIIKNYSDPNIDINYYSDSDKKVKINIVYKDNTIYIQTNNKVENINDSSAFELVNDHYKKVDKSVYEKYNFNNEEIENKKYSNLYNMITMIKVGIRKIRGYSKLRKLSLLTFLLAGIMIMYSIMSTIGALTEYTEDYNYDDMTYIKVQSNDINKVSNILSDSKEVNYIVPTEMKFQFAIPLNDYFQTNYYSQEFKASLGASSNLLESNLIYGRLPLEGEIVIDKRVYDSIVEDYTSNNLVIVGINDIKDMLDRVITIGDDNYKIVGIADTTVKEVFVNNNDLIKVISYASSSNIYSNNILLYDEVNVNITEGNIPKLNEILVNEIYKDEYPINSKSDIKINDNLLVVVGYYKSDTVFENLISYSTLEEYLYSNNNYIIVSSNDKDKTITTLKKNNITSIDLYDDNYKEYISDKKNSLNSTLTVTSVIFIITLCEMFFVIRASFQSRIKEVGIMRSIGVKRSDIYRMFAGEIIVSTTKYGLLGIILCYLFYYALSDIKTIARTVCLNPLLIVLSAMILYVFNIIIGLLPVWFTIRDTPAKILSRKDI